MHEIGRRTLVGGLAAASAWPVLLNAQQDRMRLIGALLGIAEGSPEGLSWVAALRSGLEEAGWIEGRNIRLEVRWPAADPKLMREQAQDLSDQRCEVVITHATPGTRIWRRVAPTIANVFVAVADPIGSGFVESFAHPGGNSTGFTNFEPAMGGKWVELLNEVAPGLTNVAILLNPETFPGGFNSQHVQAVLSAAASKGMTAQRLPFADADEVKSGFGALDGRTTGAVVFPDTSTTEYSKLIVDVAEKTKVAAIYAYRDFVRSGGLLCYGIDRTDLYYRAASYVDRLLRGSKPADLPVQAPTKFEMAINLRTAKKLGLTISPELMARADDVIE
jgi:putative tryptophan/tyrosine transport system substrate-binding protein